MKSILIAVAVALVGACGGGDDEDGPHAITMCGSSWNMPSAQCESACAAMPEENGSACSGCFKTFTSDGLTGCCIGSLGDPADGSDDEIVFHECE